MAYEKPDAVALSIQGREINYEFQIVDINKVQFYRKNPRIATILSEHSGEATDEVIYEKLWDRPETHKLYRRIEKDGGLIHPIIVYKGEVLEGNTRLCCYRHLYSTTNDKRWMQIKCHVILEDLTQDEIYRLLCTEHIEGKIEWEAYEKANLYRKMKDEERMTLQQISTLVGESPTQVNFKIQACKLMIESGVIDKHKYSHFEQLVSNQKIQEIKRDRDSHIQEKIIELIKDGKIKNAVDVRKVPDIYKNKKARKRLLEEKQDIEQVYHDLKAQAPMTASPFMKDVESLIKRVRELQREEREGLGKSKRDLLKIKELVKELFTLCTELDIKIHIPKNLRGN
jgi:polyhydroxyalkanoate synthesis regulator phasin